MVGNQPEEECIEVHSSACGMSCGFKCPKIDIVDNIKYLGLFVDCHLR